MKRGQSPAATFTAASLPSPRWAISERRFPPPWTLVTIPGWFKVVDAQGQSLAYVYSRKSAADAHIAGVLTEDEARRIASNIAKPPTH
jgi:hypothetical protein